jgi:5-formyltetrahydrofolate cyclo-ligase
MSKGVERTHIDGAIPYAALKRRTGSILAAGPITSTKIKVPGKSRIRCIKPAVPDPAFLPRHRQRTARQRQGFDLVYLTYAALQPMEFWSWRPGVKLGRGIWNISVPRDRDPVMPTALLVPLLGFDAAGYRLGHGGGY